MFKITLQVLALFVFLQVLTVSAGTHRLVRDAVEVGANVEANTVATGEAGQAAAGAGANGEGSGSGADDGHSLVGEFVGKAKALIHNARDALCATVENVKGQIKAIGKTMNNTGSVLVAGVVALEETCMKVIQTIVDHTTKCVSDLTENAMQSFHNTSCEIQDKAKAYIERLKECGKEAGVDACPKDAFEQIKTCFTSQYEEGKKHATDLANLMKGAQEDISYIPGNITHCISDVRNVTGISRIAKTPGALACMTGLGFKLTGNSIMFGTTLGLKGAQATACIVGMKLSIEGCIAKKMTEFAAGAAAKGIDVVKCTATLTTTPKPAPQ